MIRRHVQKICVPFEYPVYFTKDIFSPENPDFKEAICRSEPNRRHRLFVVLDQGIVDAWPKLAADIERYVQHHRKSLELAAQPVIVPGGEQVKSSPETIQRLHRLLHELRFDRQSFVVIIGGGAVQDMAGFAAATVHRGLRVVRVPTTVLSQNDSGVGVKNGINAFGIKNFLGTFAPPFAVLSDVRFLDTLSTRDRIAGMAEAVKVALIRDDQFFRWLGEHAEQLASFEPEATGRMVQKGAELHMEHTATSGDPFEFGAARPLDFGHWAAHKLETMTGYSLRHGEAVAIGMALDTRYSVEAGLLEPRACEDICRLMERLGLRLWDDALLTVGNDGRLKVLGGLADFREHLGGELTVTLLERIGRGVEVHEIHEDLVVRSIQWLRRTRNIR